MEVMADSVVFLQLLTVFLSSGMLKALEGTPSLNEISVIALGMSAGWYVP